MSFKIMSFKKKNVREIDDYASTAVLDKYVLQCLLVIHAIMRFDTTSAIYEKGKTKKVRGLCSVFMKTNATQEDIGNAGIQLFVILYNGKPSVDL